MRVTLRALSVATGLLWLFLGVFLATVIYSATEIRIEDISTSMEVRGAAFCYNISITIYNGGFHDIENLTLSTAMIYNLTGDVIVEQTSFLPAIKKGEHGTLTHDVILDLAAVAARDPELFRLLMLNDSGLVVAMSVSLVYAYVFKTELATNSTAQWGAPLSGLRAWAFELVNGTLCFNMTFANKSPMGYVFWVEVLNDRGEGLGLSDTITVPPGSLLYGRLGVPVDMSLWTGSGTIIVHLDVEGTRLALPVVEYHV